MTKAQIIWKSIGVSVTALLLVGAVISGFRMTPTDAPCVSMRYLIEDKSERMYLTESELNMLLYAEDVYPLGRKLNLVSLHRIERAIKAHPMVRTAECYLTPRNEVRVQITVTCADEYGHMACGYRPACDASEGGCQRYRSDRDRQCGDADGGDAVGGFCGVASRESVLERTCASSVRTITVYALSLSEGCEW